MKRVDDDVPGKRTVDGCQRLTDGERRTCVRETDLDNLLGSLGDHQIAQLVAVAFGHRDGLEVSLVVSRPRRSLLRESVAHLTDQRRTFIRVRHTGHSSTLRPHLTRTICGEMDLSAFAFRQRRHFCTTITSRVITN